MSDGGRKLKVCLLGSALRQTNFGVNVLALGTIRSLLHSYPDAAISILDYARKPQVYELQIDGSDIEVPLVNIRFSKKPWQPNHIAFLLFLACLSRMMPTKSLRARLIQGNSSLVRLDEMDLVTAISGGDSFSDIYGMTRFIYVSFPQILAILLGKKLILLPQTLGPFRAGLTRLVARFILRRAERIYTRDRLGTKTVESLLGNDELARKVVFRHDVGFVVEPTKPWNAGFLRDLDSWKSAGPLTGLNVSGLLFMGGYTRNNMFGLGTDYRELTHAIISWFRDLDRGTLLLVPHVMGSQNPESDLSVCTALLKEWRPVLGKRIQLVDPDLNEREVKFVIGNCDFFSGARMHACIAALSQTVPTVPIAYSDKFIGVMQTIGVEAQVADPRIMSRQEILELLTTAYESRAAIQENLRRRIPGVIQSTLSLFERIIEDGLHTEPEEPLRESRISTH